MERKCCSKFELNSTGLYETSNVAKEKNYLFELIGKSRAFNRLSAVSVRRRGFGVKPLEKYLAASS